MSERWLALALLLLPVVPGCVSASSSRMRVETSVRDVLGAPDLTIGDEEADDDDPGATRLAALLGAPIGPDEAVAITLLGSPEVRAALAELGIARAAVLTASTPPNVELDSEMRFGGGGDEVEAHVVIDLAQLIVLPLRRAAADAELEAAELEAADTILALTFVARRAVIDAQRAEARAAVLAQAVEVTRAAWRTATELYEAGNVARLTPATEEAMHQEARLMLARAELEALEAREAAVVAMGLSGATAAIELSPLAEGAGEEPPELADLEPHAVERSLRLLSIEASMRGLGGRQDVSRMRGLLPELRAGVSGSYAEQRFAFGPAFTVVLPIFDQGLGPSDALEAELRMTAERWTAEAIGVRSRVRRARNRLLSFRAQASFCENELLPARSRVLTETLLQYDAMAATPFAILQARRAEIDAATTCVDARADHAIARAALAQILAGGSVELGAVARSTSSATRAAEEH